MAANNSLTVQIKRGTSAQTASYTGPLAELIVDTDQKTLTIQDGVTPGGIYLSRLDFAQAAYNAANSAGSSAFVQQAYNQANIATILAQSSYNFSNVTNIYAQGGFAQANSANVLAQSAYNQANSSNVLAQSAYASSNTKFSSSGGTISGAVTIQNDLTVTGNITFTGNVTSVTVTGNTGQFFGYSSNGFNSLYTGIPTGYLIEPQMITQFTANYDGYAGVNHQNINSGANSSSDIFLTADNGTAIEGYVDLGIGSSTYNYPGYGLIKPNDGYFYVSGNTTTGGGNVIIATYLTNDIIFATNGLDTPNEVLRITAANTVLIKSSIATTSKTSGALQVVGGVGIQGDVQSSNVYSQGINLLAYSNTLYNFTQSSYNQANSTNTFTQSAYNQANASNVLAQSAYNQANTRASSSGYTVNSIVFANTTGYISNTINLSYYTSNNTLVTTNANIKSTIFVAYGTSQSLVDISKIALAQSFIV